MSQPQPRVGQAVLYAKDFMAGSMQFTINTDDDFVYADDTNG